MKNNHNFCHFKLANNFLSNTGAENIAKVLLATNHIVSLDLSTNNIKNEGAIVLFNHLIENQSLIELNLSSHTKEGKYRNRIKKEGIKPLKEVLTKN